MELKDAMGVLSQALVDDPDYFFGWQSNIAVAFQDEFNSTADLEGLSGEDVRDQIHAISNTAAKNFLDVLMKDIANV